MYTADTAEDLAEPTTFLVPGSPYFLAPLARVTGGMTVGAIFELVAHPKVPGEPVGYIPVFTDSDLAERYIAERGAEAVGYVPFRFMTADELVRALEQLAANGSEYLAFDPNPTAASIGLHRIGEVIAAVNARDR